MGVTKKIISVFVDCRNEQRTGVANEQCEMSMRSEKERMLAFGK